MAGKIPGRSFGSVEEAQIFAGHQLTHISGLLTTINNYGGGDATVGGDFTAAHQATGDAEFDAFMTQLAARSRDSLEAARLYLPVYTQELEKSFGIDGPIIEEVDGKLRVRQFDIALDGETFARSLGRGVVAEYRPDGTLKLDKYS
ncbi:hypothetical protein [Rubellimicrobium aerolatum]|uniref:Uncharacterized protein n=1 Tax=Rubellimicrobium aerolatum TaxID=490979 RepID=A0ABW0S8R5_9RHOB|nr:hypothetical protein [Rubellimicrobium aerolatum]MBP1804700.1 hypothetical protein [Rubellimicrobium aerolatum]